MINKNAKRIVQQKGFTIVELLIVIVVIGILAAITIVSFNGVQSRARNAQTVLAAKSYATAFQGYLIQNGSYPAIGAWTNYCLGQAVASCTAATGNWTRDATLESALLTVIKPLPVPSNGPGTNTTYDPNLGYIPARGPTDDPKLNGVNSGFLIYVLEGDTPCPVGAIASGGWPNFFSASPAGGHTYYLSGVSGCWVPLPAK